MGGKGGEGRWGEGRREVDIETRNERREICESRLRRRGRNWNPEYASSWMTRAPWNAGANCFRKRSNRGTSGGRAGGWAGGEEGRGGGGCGDSKRHSSGRDAGRLTCLITAKRLFVLKEGFGNFERAFNDQDLRRRKRFQTSGVFEGPARPPRCLGVIFEKDAGYWNGL